MADGATQGIDPLEWDCQDCGCHVLGFGYSRQPDALRCATCQWLIDFVPCQQEREELRALLRDGKCHDQAPPRRDGDH